MERVNPQEAVKSLMHLMLSRLHFRSLFCNSKMIDGRAEDALVDTGWRVDSHAGVQGKRKNM